MHEQLVHALADLRVLLRVKVGRDVLVDRRPGVAAVVAAERTGRRDGDVHRAVHDLDRVAAHAACAGLPVLSRRVLEEATVHFPGDAAVARPKQHTGVATEPQFRVVARLDVPGGVELEAGFLRQADVLRTLPVPAEILRAMHGRRRRCSCSSPRTGRRRAGRRSRGTPASPAAAGPPAPSPCDRRCGGGTTPSWCRRVRARPSGKTLAGRVVVSRNNRR